ncbi:MAG: hypothetical protein Q7S59_11280 [Sulfurimonas sp.]|nr:hypothetical protein [Sulfurimonas sp.]
MKRKIILSVQMLVVALLFASCATKGDLDVMQLKNNSETSRTDNLIVEMKNKTSELREVSQKLIELRIDNKQSTKEYENLKKKDDSLAQEIYSIIKGLEEIKQKGGQSASEILKIQTSLDENKKSRKEIINWFIEEWKKIENS